MDNETPRNYREEVLVETLVDILVMSDLSDSAGTELKPFYRTARQLLPFVRAVEGEAIARFDQELAKRNWSTSTQDVNAAKEAALND